MSVTETELAEHLTKEYHEGPDDMEELFRGIARRAAELLGAELAPAKPEPGTWHLTKTEGWPAFVEDDGDLNIVPPNGDRQVFFSRESDTWPALTPARVVPAEPVELTEAEVGECHDSTPESSGYGWLEWTKPSRECFTATVNAALAKHGHGRVEVPRDYVKLTETEIQISHAISDSFKHGLKLPMASDVSEATNRVMDIVGPLLGGVDRG